MDLLKELKKIDLGNVNLPVFIRLKTAVGNIREVSLVNSRIYKKEDGDFCQILSIRNSDFDKDYANDFYNADGIELEEYEDDELEELEISSVNTVEQIIKSLERQKNNKIKDVRYSALLHLNGIELNLLSIEKDDFSVFGMLEPCYIIEVEK